MYKYKKTIKKVFSCFYFLVLNILSILLLFSYVNDFSKTFYQMVGTKEIIFPVFILVIIALALTNSCFLIYYLVGDILLKKKSIEIENAMKQGLFVYLKEFFEEEDCLAETKILEGLKKYARENNFKHKFRLKIRCDKERQMIYIKCRPHPLPDIESEEAFICARIDERITGEDYDNENNEE